MKKLVRFFPLIFALLIILFFVISFGTLQRDRKTVGRQQLEEVLRQTSVTCYASEGFYPPNLDYMRRHYGLFYDEKEYVVYYELFASNLMPVISVLEK